MIEAIGAVELDIQDKGWSESGPSLLQSEGLPSAHGSLTTSLPMIQEKKPGGKCLGVNYQINHLVAQLV